MERKQDIHEEHFQQLPLDSDTLSEDSRDVHTENEPYSASGDDLLPNGEQNPGSDLDHQRKTSSKLDVSAGAHQLAINNSNLMEEHVQNKVDRTHQELQNKKRQPNSKASTEKQLPSKPGLYDTWLSKGLESLKRDNAQIRLEKSLRLTAAPQNFQLSSRSRPELDLSAPVKKPARKKPQPQESVPDDSAAVPEPPSDVSQFLELPRSRISSPFPRNPVRAITEQLEDLRLHLSSDYPNSGSVLPDTPEIAPDPLLKIDPFARAGTEAASHVDATPRKLLEHVSNTSLGAGPEPDFIVRSANSTSKTTPDLGFDTIAATLPDLTKFNASISEPETVEPETLSPKAVEAESVDAETAASEFSLPSDDSAIPQEENLDETMSSLYAISWAARKAVTGMYGPEADALTNEDFHSRVKTNIEAKTNDNENAHGDANGDNEVDASANAPSRNRRERGRNPTHVSKLSHRRQHIRDHRGRRRHHRHHRHKSRHGERRRERDEKQEVSDSLHMMDLQRQRQLMDAQERQRRMAIKRRLQTQQEQLASQQQQLSTQQQEVVELRAELGRSQEALTVKRQQQQHAQKLLEQRENEMRLKEQQLALRAVDVEDQQQLQTRQQQQQQQDIAALTAELGRSQQALTEQRQQQQHAQRLLDSRESELRLKEEEQQDMAALRAELSRSQQALTEQRQQQQHAQRLLDSRESELRLKEEQLALKAESLVDVEQQLYLQSNSQQQQDMAALRAELGRSQQALTEQRQQQQHAQRLLDLRESELRLKEQQFAFSSAVQTLSQAQSQQVPDRPEVSSPANNVAPEVGGGEQDKSPARKANRRAGATSEARTKASTEPPPLPDTPQELVDCMMRQMKKHAMTASSMFKIMDSKRTDRVSQRQFASGLENIGIYSGRTTRWTREAGATPATGSRRSLAKRKMSPRQKNKTNNVSWTLTLSRTHMNRLFEVFDYNSERNISWKDLQRVLSKKSKKSASKTSPELTSKSPTEANDAASKSINSVAAAAADPPANQPQSYTGPAPNASLAALQSHATPSQQSSAPAANIFPNTTPPVSATFPNARSQPMQTALPPQTSSLSTSMPAPSSWTAPRPSTAAYTQAPDTAFGAPRPAVNLAGTWPQRLRHVVASASPPHEPLSPEFFSLPRRTNRPKYRRRSDQPRSRHRQSNRPSRARAARWLDRPRAQLTLVANAPMGLVPAPLRLKLRSLLESASRGSVTLPPVWRGQKPSDVLDLRFMASGRFRFCVSARVSVDLALRSADPNSTNVAIAVELAKELTRRGWMWERKDRDSADLRWCGSSEAIRLSHDPNPGFGPRVPPYQMINHFPHMATVCRRPCLWYEPSVRLHAKLQFALAHWLHTMRLPKTSHALAPGAAAASSLVATKQKAVVASAMALMSTPRADASALITAFTGLGRAWVVERPDKLQLHLLDACANADSGWHALQLSNWLSEYAMCALAVPLLEMVWARVDRGQTRDVLLMVAAPVQAALALLRKGEVRCHSRQQWGVARAILDYGWTADELMHQAELCVSEAVTKDVPLPPATELEIRRQDLAATVQKLRECGTDSPVWCVKITYQDDSEQSAKSKPFDSEADVDQRSPNQAVTVTFESLTGLFSVLQDSAAPRVVLQRFPAIKSLLQAEHGLVAVRQWAVVLSLQPLVVVGYKDLFPYTCRPHPHGEGMRLEVSQNAHRIMPQAQWRSLLHQQEQKYQQSTAAYLKEIQERIRHVVVSHLRAHATPGCFGAAPARHPAPGKSEVDFHLHQRQGSFQWMNFDFLVLTLPQQERVWLADVSLTPQHCEQPLGPRATQMLSHAMSGMSQLTGLLLDGLGAQRDAGQVWHLWANDGTLDPPVNMRRSADLLEAHDFDSARDLRSELCDTLRPTWLFNED